MAEAADAAKGDAKDEAFAMADVAKGDAKAVLVGFYPSKGRVLSDGK